MVTIHSMAAAVTTRSTVPAGATTALMAAPDTDTVTYQHHTALTGDPTVGVSIDLAGGTVQ